MREDIAPILSSMILLKHTPTYLLDEVSKMNTLASFKSLNSIWLLFSMVNSKIMTHQDIYEKLWDRVLQDANKLPSKRCRLVMKAL